jgi:hypothetical protein
MSSMTDEELRAIFDRVKVMSSPLWKTDSRGYLTESQELTTVFTIGVYDQSKGVIQGKYKDVFTLGPIMPTFATTHQTDRITFFQSQCYSPAYAVNNMLGYKSDADEKFEREAFPVYYIDERLHHRMLADGFDIIPRTQTPRVLPNWVNAIVYGFVKYDELRKSYCIESEQGDILFGGILDLGERRDLAFEQFQLKGLDKEVEKRLQSMILEKGRPTVEAVIRGVKNDSRNYLSKYAQLSPIELDRVLANDPAYQMVRDMLVKEVSYLKEID